MAKNRISELKVMKSAAGYYIGRELLEDNVPVAPYSRNSQYFKTEKLAHITLANIDEYYIEV